MKTEMDRIFWHLLIVLWFIAGLLVGLAALFLSR